MAWIFSTCGHNWIVDTVDKHKMFIFTSWTEAFHNLRRKCHFFDQTIGGAVLLFFYTTVRWCLDSTSDDNTSSDNTSSTIHLVTLHLTTLLLDVHVRQYIYIWLWWRAFTFCSAMLDLHLFPCSTQYHVIVVPLFWWSTYMQFSKINFGFPLVVVTTSMAEFVCWYVFRVFSL